MPIHPTDIGGSHFAEEIALLLAELCERHGPPVSETGAQGLHAVFLICLHVNHLDRLLSSSGDEVNLNLLFCWLDLTDLASDQPYRPGSGLDVSHGM